ncbi:MAG: hypothetical protein PHH54_00880 [Candidatus Nanoarchaeia archaeon]|nr:hypothetical protein [Candidatus Nanoarchaeia archaeon]MDD5740517.1 hypothetical protein [Candidatus Nanoarchaeia archaeon]
MQVKYDNDQDITLFLTAEESNALEKGPTKHFADIHNSSKNLDKDGKGYILLRGTCMELRTYFFLGYGKDPGGFFKNASDMEGLGKILIPESENSSWYINLSEKGFEHFQKGWPHGIRYNGSNKLFIKKEE